MNRCPVCQWDNEDPEAPGTVVCANATCGASYSWPLPEPAPSSQSELNIDVVLAFMGELVNQLTPAERQELAAQVNSSLTGGIKTAPRSTTLKGDGKSHTTDADATCVRVHIFCPDTAAPMRARPTINGVPLAAGSGEIRYDNPGGSMIVETRAGNNDVLIIEEFS